MSRHLVVLNPHAGRARRRHRPEDVADAFRRRGLSCDIAVTEGPGHAARIVAERGEAFDVIVSAGGDGTLHEVIQTLDLERHALALLPAGTGNDFAWVHGWPVEREAAMNRIAAARERRVDLARWEVVDAAGRRAGRFHNNVGLGFEALVNAASQRVTRLKGPAVYLVALARTIPRYRNYPLNVAFEGGSWSGDIALAAILNGRRVGGVFLLAPEARVDDGKLDLVIVEGRSLAGAMLLLPRTLRGRHRGARGVHTVRAPWFHIEDPEGFPAYVDGEFVGEGLRSFRAEALPGALRLL